MPSRIRTLASVLISTQTAMAAQFIAPTTTEATVVVRAAKPWVSVREFRAARHTADAILGRAGIGMSWLECWPHDRATAQVSADCTHVPHTVELILRIIPGSDSKRLDQAALLGYAFVDLQAGAGTLSTVYADHVAALAHRAGTDGTLLLGRAIAHEIGHLLLGTNRHGTSGLMRGAWSDIELRRNAKGDWLFSEEEAEAMRRAVARRHLNGSSRVDSSD